MNLFLLLMLLLVPTALGLTLAVTGLRNDMCLRRGTPYNQRGPKLLEHIAWWLSVPAFVQIPRLTLRRGDARP